MLSRPENLVFRKLTDYMKKDLKIPNDQVGKCLGYSSNKMSEIRTGRVKAHDFELIKIGIFFPEIQKKLLEFLVEVKKDPTGYQFCFLVDALIKVGHPKAEIVKKIGSDIKTVDFFFEKPFRVPKNLWLRLKDEYPEVVERTATTFNKEVESLKQEISRLKAQMEEDHRTFENYMLSVDTKLNTLLQRLN